MKLTKEQAEAWNRYRDNFNNLPYEIRKALPDLTILWSNYVIEEVRRKERRQK